MSDAAPPGHDLSALANVPAAQRQRSSFLLLARAQVVRIKVADVSGAPGHAVPLDIQLLGAGGEDQLLIFTGLPDGVTLSPGGKLGKFWAVNSNVVSNVTLQAPQNFSGSFTITVTQKQASSAAESSASFKVSIGEPPMTVTSATHADQIEVQKPPRNPNPNEERMLARANELFQNGDVSGARSILEYLAVEGSAAAAMAMAETYDPITLGKMVIKGLTPDAQKAREWYLKAETLGGTEARGRLNNLANR